MSTPLIIARGLGRTYTGGSLPIAALKGLELEVASGERVAIVGRSGSGKSTLLNVLGGLDRGYLGSLKLGGVELRTLSDRQLSAHRGRTVGFVFQSFQLLPHLSILENVLVPTTFTANDTAEADAVRLLDAVGLGQRLHDPPSRLSGGQQQRVAIARALINRPKLLLCDEPTGNLDMTSSAEVMALLLNVHAAQGTTLVIITHEPHIAAHCERVLRLEDGRLVEDSRGGDVAEQSSPSLRQAEGDRDEA